MLQAIFPPLPKSEFLLAQMYYLLEDKVILKDHA
jgi:hypothetical protein